MSSFAPLCRSTNFQFPLQTNKLRSRFCIEAKKNIFPGWRQKGFVRKPNISNFEISPNLCLSKVIRSIIKIGGGGRETWWYIWWYRGRSKQLLIEYSCKPRMMRLLANPWNPGNQEGICHHLSLEEEECNGYHDRSQTEAEFSLDHNSSQALTLICIK